MNAKELAEQVSGIEENLHAALELAEKERAELGVTTEETGQKVTELTEQFAEATVEQAEKAEQAGEREAELVKRVDELETAQRRGEGFPDQGEKLMLPGQRFTASEEYNRMIRENDKRSAPVTMPTFFPGVKFGRKTDFLSTPPERLVVPERVEDIFAPALRALRMRDLIPVRPTQSNAVDYVREVGFNTGGSVSVTSIAVASGIATVTQTAHGYHAGERIRHSGVTDETDLNDDNWILDVTGVDTYTFETTAGDTGGAAGTIVAIRLQVHGAAAETAEGAAKPEAQLDLELLTCAIQTIAHWIPASRQILMDSGQVESYINDRLRYGVLYREDSQILYGTGASPQIQGILTEAGVQLYKWSAGVSGDTKIDAIRRGMTRAQVQEYAPTGLVVNPNDWEDIQLEKGTDDRYVWASVATGTGMVFFLLPVVVTNAILEGQALVGSFEIASTLWDREQAMVRVSDSHEDLFVKNMVVLLGEERMCQTIYRPDAFVEVEFDSAP